MNTPSRNPIDHFDTRATDWNSLYTKPVFKQRLSLFLDSVISHVPPGSTVLDFGCGGGMISIKLSQKSNYDIFAVDGSAEMIKSAKTLASEHKADIEFSTIDQFGENLQSNTYDAIICSSVIEYVEQDDSLLENLSRSLKIDGNLFISIPNSHSLLGMAEDISKKIGIRKLLSNEPDVVFANKRYSIPQFVVQLERHNLNLQSTTPFECPFFGSLGTSLSKSKYIGMMTLVHAKKCLRDNLT